MNTISLKYKDKRDKACGIAGMAITLAVCDGLHLLNEVDYEAPDGSNMVMSAVFNTGGNPRMSAKSVWTQSLKDLRAVTSMVLGNIACRRMMRSADDGHKGGADALRALVREQGQTYCSLEGDEADALYDSCNGYVRRIFSHSALVGVVDEFCTQIAQRPRMTANEIAEFLACHGIR